MKDKKREGMTDQVTNLVAEHGSTVLRREGANEVVLELLEPG